MQLGQSEPLRMLDDHDGGVRYIDPNFDDRGRHQYADLTGPESPHHLIPLGGLELAVHQPHGHIGPSPDQGVGHGLGRQQVGLLGLLDDRKDHVGLTAGPALGLDEVEHLVALVRPPDHRADGPPARRALFDDAQVEVPVPGQRQ